MLSGTASKIKPMYKSSLLILHHPSITTIGKTAINKKSLNAPNTKSKENARAPIRAVLSVNHDFTCL